LTAKFQQTISQNISKKKKLKFNRQLTAKLQQTVRISPKKKKKSKFNAQLTVNSNRQSSVGTLVKKIKI
jgi:hypothetical protein